MNDNIEIEDVKDFVRKIHFDFEKSEKKLQSLEEYEDFWLNNKHNYKQFVVKNQDAFKKNLDVFLDKNKNLIEKAKLNEVLFTAILKEFNALRYLNIISKVEKESEDTKAFVDTLMQDGIAIKRNLFSKEDLKELIMFQSSIENALGKDVHDAGYVGISRTINGHTAFNRKQKVNDGQLRLQSKNIGFLPPGSDKVIENKFVNTVFEKWHDAEKVKFHRVNMEWISPTEINHNGWHIDVVRDQLKLMILLGPVDYDTAPMFYAKKSHNLNNDFEKKLCHSLMLNGAVKKMSIGKMKGNHAAALEGRHVGYVSDDYVENCPKKINSENIKIHDTFYEKEVCIGDVGDCVFFETSGFHSGNRSFGKVRRSAVFTIDNDNVSYKNLFLTKINAIYC